MLDNIDINQKYLLPENLDTKPINSEKKKTKTKKENKNIQQKQREIGNVGMYKKIEKADKVVNRKSYS